MNGEATANTEMSSLPSLSQETNITKQQPAPDETARLEGQKVDSVSMDPISDAAACLALDLASDPAPVVVKEQYSAPDPVPITETPPQAPKRHLDTPLDVFFLSFPEYEYNPDLPPNESYDRLRRHFHWKRGDPEGNEAWQDYQKALADEVRVWFGKENDIKAWHTLCRAVGVTNLPETCLGCQKVLRKTHVNIVDLVAWGRDDYEGEPLVVFESVEDLRAYTFAENKIFPQAEVVNDRGEDNIVLRHLLRDFKKLSPEKRGRYKKTGYRGKRKVARI